MLPATSEIFEGVRDQKRTSVTPPPTEGKAIWRDSKEGAAHQEIAWDTTDALRQLRQQLQGAFHLLPPPPPPQRSTVPLSQPPPHVYATPTGDALYSLHSIREEVSRLRRVVAQSDLPTSSGAPTVICSGSAALYSQAAKDLRMRFKELSLSAPPSAAAAAMLDGWRQRLKATTTFRQAVHSAAALCDDREDSPLRRDLDRLMLLRPLLSEVATRHRTHLLVTSGGVEGGEAGLASFGSALDRMGEECCKRGNEMAAQNLRAVIARAQRVLEPESCSGLEELLTDLG